MSEQRWGAVVNPVIMDGLIALAPDPAFGERFWSKVDKRTVDYDDDCWIWTAALSSEGYGNMRCLIDGVWRNVRSHRIAWFITYPHIIDTDLVLDHLVPVCRGRYCVNPMHLDPVTRAENTARGTGVGAAIQRSLRAEHLLERDTRERPLATPERLIA